MFDANEIGLDWKGTLQTLGSAAYSKASSGANGRLKDTTGNHRCFLKVEETIADGTFGKLVWGKRYENDKEIDCLIKCPPISSHTKQEAVIQWLCHKSLKAHNLEDHCADILDVFTMNNSIWFSMVPIYNAPILDKYLASLPFWGMPFIENGQALLKILCQLAMCCCVLEREIGFNHRDLKPDNVLVKLDTVRIHSFDWIDSSHVTIAKSPLAVLVDFGFSCLGPGRASWIQSGDGILPPFDPCPKIGRDIFILLVFLIWRKDVRNSLSITHLDFLKSSLHLSKERWTQMIHLNQNPSDWIYILITERGFQCPALDPWTWLKSCAIAFPEVVSIRIQSGSNTLS